MKHRYRLRYALMTALTLTLGVTASVQASHTTQTKPVKLTKATKPVKLNKAKISYIVGWDLARSLPPVVRQDLDPMIVARTLQAELSGKKRAMSEAEYTAVKKAFIAKLRAKVKAKIQKEAAANKKAGAEFLARNKKRRGVRVRPSGLQYQVLSRGKGKRPGDHDTVKVKYVGKLINGTVFDDSSHRPGGVASIPLVSVIPGFREGLKLMRVGSHYRLFVPSDLAYGEVSGGQMPPNSTLIFDVTLTSIVPAKSRQIKK